MEEEIEEIEKIALALQEKFILGRTESIQFAIKMWPGIQIKKQAEAINNLVASLKEQNKDNS